MVGRLVVCNAVRLALGGRKITRHVDGNLRQSHLDRCLESGMPDDDDTVLVDDERLAESELLE